MIHADLTTRMENAASPRFSVAPGFDLMMYVVTGQGVTGDILVKGNMNDTQLVTKRYDSGGSGYSRLRARLDSLIIGPSATIGLQGNVEVEQGYIRRIFTTAPIGQPGAPVSIEGGRVYYETNSNAVSQIRVTVHDGNLVAGIIQVWAVADDEYFLLRGNPILLAVSRSGSTYTVGASMGGTQVAVGSNSFSHDVRPKSICFGDENTANSEQMEWFGGEINTEQTATVAQMTASLQSLDFLSGGIE